MTTLNRVALIGALSLLAGNSIRAADSHTNLTRNPLDIRVQTDGFGKAGPADITAVLQSAGFQLWRYCPRTQLNGIDVYHRSDHPQIDFELNPSGHIAIGLATQDTYWAQYSFQFAHEFCHALANYSNHQRKMIRRSRNANLWLEESLCETASLFALRAMSREWQTSPPFPAWRTYAPWLNAYVERRLALPEHHLPAGTSFPVWFRSNQAALRQNSDLRDRNTMIAIQLLPLFEAEPHSWETLAFLNGGSPNANKSLAQHLAEWRSRCPKNLRPFLVRLAAVF